MMEFYHSIDGNEYEESIIKGIDRAKELYDEQVDKTHKATYIMNVLRRNYVEEIRKHTSRYDYLGKIFSESQNEIGNRLKKDRPNFETLQSFIREDFFNNDKKFKLVEIVSLGYATYGWRLDFDGYGVKCFVEIPMVNNITTENIDHATYGMFTFGVYYEEEYSSISTLKASYRIEEIAEFIKEYFKSE